ncbi:ECF-type sigma factor, partial [Symmachiella dynata]|uniref:ECF-type sigma factor n=1 Tax=Symmachiella dynata TaxID=2527995 RepID=UPI0030EEEECC
MQRNDSVMTSVEGLKQGNELAAHDLWNRYFSQLVALAKNKLPLHVKRSFDEEDVALSAFHSLCTGLQESRFPDLEDRDNLWAILVVITTRKA